MKRSYTFASWNIAGARKMKSDRLFDYGRENIEYFADQIKEISADVVCLQEVHSNKKVTMAQKLAKPLSMRDVFDSPSSPSHIDDKFKLGTAIISRLPFKRSKCYRYPDPWFDLYFSNGKKAITHHKNLQIVSIGGFWVANTQLLPIGIFGYEYDRGEGKELARKIEKVLFQIKTPIIFCGDFNYNNPPKIYPNFFKKLRLKEALPDRTTRPNPEGKKKSPDHIYYSEEFRLLKSGVINTKTDHFLCYAKFELKS